MLTWSRFVGVVILAAGMMSSSSFAVKIIPEELQTTIVRLYSEGNCDQVRSIARGLDLTLLRPNVMAVTAWCEPEGKDPEALFLRAETLSPTGDLILVLHAKWQWKKDREKSRPIWERVLIIARNDYFRVIAKEYLADVVSESTNAKPMDLSPTTGFIRFSVSGVHKLHPQPLEFSYLRTHSSNGMSLNGFFSRRKWINYGSLAFRYETTWDQFFQASEFNQWTNRLESPIAIHVATSKDIIFRPFVGYRSLGGNPFSLDYGIGVMGAVYKSEYVQSVQALLYSTRIFKSPLTPEEGAHYRFEYTWDFYPMLWFISTQFAIDHTSSDPTTSFLGSTGHFEHSNNRFSINLRFERELARVTFALEPSFAYRINTDSSSFPRPSDHVVVDVKEEDFEWHGKFTAALPLATALKAFAWYEWTRVQSNLEDNAYVNRNLTDHTVGVGLRTYFSTY